ncbi:hypothetical protein CHARACLAT_014864 [Characodon lateralis]|uniref:Uncharacterized protein n=1 Tax=Characodon lateralis TaxID=208331 RepID=A0ABU7E278_9TELE|nr:hypothetical protein [Characodon lateralis]
METHPRPGRLCLLRPSQTAVGHQCRHPLHLRFIQPISDDVSTSHPDHKVPCPITVTCSSSSHGDEESCRGQPTHNKTRATTSTRKSTALCLHTINRYSSPNNTIKRRSTRKDERAQSPRHSDMLGSELCLNLQTYTDFLSFLNNPEIKPCQNCCALPFLSTNLIYV